MCACERMNTACKRVLVVLLAGLMAWFLRPRFSGVWGLCCWACWWWYDALEGLWNVITAAIVLCGRTGMMTATWLILPVVIRSSQRLSHACVSINKFLL